ncbi:hypothetical protein [Clostridium sp. C2-6-12]|uniref:BppU family phage baseplate upper protein n=1 Tax=Clostridium sp. C2-6-12 TaxID=2698832 RepID=UPI001368130F|nr:hypothetical protein [Clostridium sp. C2-6-12]
MRKPILVRLDTITNLSETLYSNIVYSDTLQIRFKLFENGSALNLANQTITVVIEKPNGHGIEKSIDSITGNEFTLNFDAQATCVCGEVFGQVILTDGTGISISNEFSYFVKKGRQDNLIKSTDDVQTLVNLRQLVVDSQNTLDKYKDTVFKVAGTTDTLQALINIKSYIDTYLTQIKDQNADAIIKIDGLKSAKVDVNAVINNANLTKQDMLNVIDLSDATKANLNSKINLATSKEGDLNNAVNNANSAKESLLLAKQETEQLIQQIQPISSKIAQIDKNTQDISNHVQDNIRHFNVGEKEALQLQLNQMKDLLNLVFNANAFYWILEPGVYVTDDSGNRIIL